MAVALTEHELESLGEFEFEHELEGEFEGAFEHEFEAESPEMFGWGDIKNWAGRQWKAVQTPGSWQNNAVRLTDRAILAAAPDIGGAIAGDRGQHAGKAVQTIGMTLIPERWREHEYEFEMEGEISPVTRIYPDAMMEHMAYAAMEAESEHEAAEGFLPLIPLIAGKLLPLAAKMLPKVAGKVLPKIAQTVSRVTPHLTRGVGNLAKTLHRNPQTRPLMPAIPSIARRAVTQIARQAASGRPVTPQSAVRTLAQANHRVLSNPKAVNAVLQRSQALDGRGHRIAGLPPAVGHQSVSRTGMPARPGARFCANCGSAAWRRARQASSCNCNPVIVVR